MPFSRTRCSRSGGCLKEDSPADCLPTRGGHRGSDSQWEREVRAHQPVALSCRQRQADRGSTRRSTDDGVVHDRVRVRQHELRQDAGHQDGGLHRHARQPRYSRCCRGTSWPMWRRSFSEPDGYVVVEKLAQAGKVAEETAWSFGHEAAETRRGWTPTAGPGSSVSSQHVMGPCWRPVPGRPLPRKPCSQDIEALRVRLNSEALLAAEANPSPQAVPRPERRSHCGSDSVEVPRR